MHPVDHLVAAVLTRDQGAITTLLDRDPSLATTRNHFGVSPVHAAHFQGDADLVERLLAGADLPAGFAAELGVLDRVEAEPGALLAACYWGQSAVVDWLLDAGVDANSVSDDPPAISPLGSAIATTPGVAQPSDDEDVVLALVRRLLAAGADPGARRGDGMTPLHSAAWRGLALVVDELLAAGADRSVAATGGAHEGQTPADTAFWQGHLVLAARLDA